MALIGIVGKTQVGKDTVGKIIQMLTDNLLEGIPDDAVEDCVLNTPILDPSFKIVKYADKLKDCVCLILGCTREQLEDDTFKDKELGEEWFKTIWWIKSNHNNLENFNTREEAEEALPYYEENYLEEVFIASEDIMLTPRKILQLLGTEAGRQIIHPDIWVNATMANYKPISGTMDVRRSKETFPNWLITDVRFPNEVKAIKDRGGIVIKVMRDVEGRFPVLYEEWRKSTYSDFYHFVGEVHPNFYKKIMHESETALDGFTGFDARVMNDSSILDTTEHLKNILKRHKIWIKENQLILR